jgi:hypothetical protein
VGVCLLSAQVVPAIDNSYKLDFDGDGRSDLALYREGSRNIGVAPQPSYWYFLNTSTGNWGAVQWGRSLDVPTPGDFDGDGKTDFGIYRWWLFDLGDTNEYWLSRSTGGWDVMSYEWEPSYYKFARNYVGDAKAEMAHLYKINVSQDPTVPCYLSVFFVGDKFNNTVRKTVGDSCNVNPTPVPGDYDNDGHSEIAVFNNRVFKVWFAPYSPGYTAPAINQPLDVDLPAVGDYDGDGKTDFAGTKARNGRLIWRIKQSSDGAETETDFGFSTDKPVPADYDGDGKTDIAIWRASEGSWWIKYTRDGGVSNWYFGLPTDTPLAQPVIPFDPAS